MASTGTLFRHPHLAADPLQTHIVDISGKPHVPRSATAEGDLHLRPETIQRIRAHQVEKGDVETIAGLAALQAVKRTPEWLPLCHPLPIEHVQPRFQVQDDRLRLQVTVATTARTGVEMEALTAVAAGLLCAWDMLKPYEKDDAGQYPETRIDGIRVIEKRKGAPVGGQ